MHALYVLANKLKRKGKRLEARCPEGFGDMPLESALLLTDGDNFGVPELEPDDSDSEDDELPPLVPKPLYDSSDDEFSDDESSVGYDDLPDLVPRPVYDSDSDDEDEGQLPKKEVSVGETAAMSMSNQSSGLPKDLFLADSGASTFMGNSDDGMYDVIEINDPITIGNGKTMRATKIGKRKMTVHQLDGSTLDVMLPDYKCVPELQMNLFSITKACDDGWKLSNDGVKLILTKDGHTIKFDRVIKTDKGKLCGVEMFPRIEDVGDMALPTGAVKAWEINHMHRVFNHAAEDVLRATAKAYGWTVNGTFEACEDCQMSNIKQKGVPKESQTKSDKPSERVFMNITGLTKSNKKKKYWLVVVDDATGMTWSVFLDAKSELKNVVRRFLIKMQNRKTPVSVIRCDGGGENLKFRDLCRDESDPVLSGVEWELTPRDSPQFNGTAERKIAVLVGRMRVVFNAAKVSKKIKDATLADVGLHVTDIENLLMARKADRPAYSRFFDKDLPKAAFMRQFGEIAVIKNVPSIKGKLTDRGIPVMYLGRAKEHAPDTYKFLNLLTNQTIVSRDAIS